MLAKVFGAVRLQLNDSMAIFILKKSSRLLYVASGYPFHLTRYCKPIRFFLWSKTSSTINLSFPSWSMIDAGGGTSRHGPSMSRKNTSPMSRDDLHTKRWSPSRVDLPVLPRESPSGKIQTRYFPPRREISEKGIFASSLARLQLST